jgi:hypothetical protein
MRLLVCGGRDYTDRATVFAVLDRVHAHRPITCLVHGAARGADSLGAAWAISRGIHTEPHPADWLRLGKAAGPLRNAEMLATGVDGVLAFPGGRGTAHMVRIAREAGVPVWEPLRRS